jgi:hypothetical protein
LGIFHADQSNPIDKMEGQWKFIIPSEASKLCGYKGRFGLKPETYFSGPDGLRTRDFPSTVKFTQSMFLFCAGTEISPRNFDTVIFEDISITYFQVLQVVL